MGSNAAAGEVHRVWEMQLPWEMQLFAPAAASGAAPRVAPKLSLELPPELPHHSLPFWPGSGLLVAVGAGLAPGWDRLVGQRQGWWPAAGWWASGAAGQPVALEKTHAGTSRGQMVQTKLMGGKPEPPCEQALKPKNVSRPGWWNATAGSRLQNRPPPACRLQGFLSLMLAAR